MDSGYDNFTPTALFPRVKAAQYAVCERLQTNGLSAIQETQASAPQQTQTKCIDEDELMRNIMLVTKISTAEQDELLGVDISVFKYYLTRFSFCVISKL